MMMAPPTRHPLDSVIQQPLEIARDPLCHANLRRVDLRMTTMSSWTFLAPAIIRTGNPSTSS
jgi:hypothetical protein